jgi:hypothetical protein
MDDPNVVLGIDSHSDGLAQDPVVREGLGPSQIGLEAGGDDAGGVGNSQENGSACHRGRFHAD